MQDETEIPTPKQTISFSEDTAKKALGIDVSEFPARPIRWYCNQLDRYGYYISVDEALSIDLTQLLLFDLNYSWATADDDNISITGETGSGKSSLGLRIKMEKHKIVGTKLSVKDFLKDVYFDMFTFMKALRSKDLNKGDVLMLDEAGDSSIDGALSGAVFRYTHNLEQRMRALQITKLFASPFLTNHLHHYILRTWEIHRRRGTITALLETESPEGLNVEIGRINLRGFVELPFPPREIYDVYFQPKTESIGEFQENVNPLAVEKKRIADELLKNVEYQMMNKARRINYIELTYPEFRTRSTWVAEIEAMARLSNEEKKALQILYAKRNE